MIVLWRYNGYVRAIDSTHKLRETHSMQPFSVNRLKIAINQVCYQYGWKPIYNQSWCLISFTDDTQHSLARGQSISSTIKSAPVKFRQRATLSYSACYGWHWLEEQKAVGVDKNNLGVYSIKPDISLVGLTWVWEEFISVSDWIVCQTSYRLWDLLCLVYIYFRA